MFSTRVCEVIGDSEFSLVRLCKEETEWLTWLQDSVDKSYSPRITSVGTADRKSKWNMSTSKASLSSATHHVVPLIFHRSSVTDQPCNSPLRINWLGP